MTGGGSSQPVSQTTKYELSPEQRELMGLAMPGVREFAAKTPQRFQGSTVAPFDPSQILGQDMALSAANDQNTLARNAANTSNFWLSGSPWDPSNNPALAGAVTAATRPIMENFTDVINPAIGGEAVKTGGFGGSRQALAQSGAAGKAMQAVGDTSAKLVNDAYSTNVDAQLKALGLLPQTQNAQTAGAVTTSGVGDIRQGMQQALLNEQVGNFNFDQYAPFLRSKEIMALLQGLPGGSTTSTGTQPGQNKLTGALGGAASGAALGSAIMPGIGTAVGGGLGALLSFL